LIASKPATRPNTTAIGKIRIDILLYSLSKASGFADTMRPSLKARMTVSDASGTVCSSSKEEYIRCEEIKPRRMEDWFNDPDALGRLCLCRKLTWTHLTRELPAVGTRITLEGVQVSDTGRY
jgi:hypothetical protein